MFCRRVCLRYNGGMQIAPFEMERFFARYEHQVRHMLCASGPEPLTLGELLALEPDHRLGDLSLNYTETCGTPGLRQAIAGLYDGIDPEMVLLTAGSVEGIFLFLNTVLSAGDRVVVHSPCYPALYETARAIGCRIDWWHARDGWALDLHELEALLRPETRAVVVNVPHNPTGWVMPQAQWQALNETLAARGITLLSDEVYRWLEHDPADRLPAACELSDTAVSLGSMSKAFGLPGLRIGWMISRNRTLLQRAWELKDYTTICHNTPGSAMAEIALRHAGTILGRNRALALANLKPLRQWMADRPDWSWAEPKAGVTGFLRLQGEADSEAFCMRLLEESGILLLPGRYYMPERQASPHIRIGFGKRSFCGDFERFRAASGVLRIR